MREKTENRKEICRSRKIEKDGLLSYAKYIRESNGRKMKQMLKGMSDSEKLSYLFHTFGKGIYYVANRFLDDSHMSEDIVQEVMIRISRKEILQKLENMDEAAVKYYLFTTAKNLAMNYYQKRKREASVTIDSYSEEVLNHMTVEDSAEMVIRKLEEESFFEILNGISEKYADILVVKYKYGFSDKQIAESFGIKEATVRKRLERGRKKLLEQLKKCNYLDEWSYHTQGGEQHEEQEI